MFVDNIRQKPITSKKIEEWKQFPLDEFTSRIADENIERNFNRNRYLIDFEFIPNTVRENILRAWIDRTKKDRSQILNYLIEHKMKNLIENAGDF